MTLDLQQHQIRKAQVSLTHDNSRSARNHGWLQSIGKFIGHPVCLERNTYSVFQLSFLLSEKVYREDKFSSKSTVSC